MLIVIPTYNRIESLKYVLQSIVQSDVCGVSDSIRILIVNNYPPAAQDLKEMVDRFLEHDHFEWKILYRRETLPPAKNWYSAVTEYARPNEVVMMNSDDDLVFPWSIKSRYLAAVGGNADMVLAGLSDGVYFSGDSQRILYPPEIFKPNPASMAKINMSSIVAFSPQHLSNHCYRNTSIFRKALSKSFEWCHKQNWLGYNNRTIFIPLYLSLALLKLGGSVYGLRLPCVIRGIDIEEIKQSKFGIPGWNHGFIHLCAIGVMTNDDLKEYTELDVLRKQYSGAFVRWFMTYFFDPRISLRELHLTLTKCNFNYFELLSPRVFSGVKILLKDLFKMHAMRVDKRFLRNASSAEVFFDRLSKSGRTFEETNCYIQNIPK